MNLFFRELIWLALVLVLVELLYAHSRPHWFLVTLAFVSMNLVAFVGFRLARRATTSPTAIITLTDR